MTHEYDGSFRLKVSFYKTTRLYFKKEMNIQRQQLLDKKNIRIIVTDSGMGGLSVAADIAEKVKTSGTFQNVHIIFFNSSFDNSSGYNVIESHEEKIKIFNNALNSMQIRFQPDVIIIACNTLSILYPETPFSRYITIPVIGIVEMGVDLIYNNYIKNPDSFIMIFGTPTTISQNSYQSALINKGIDAKAIIGQPCYKLADYIEEDSHSNDTFNRILHFVEEAIAKLSDKEKPVIVSLNCTHYGYVADLFQKAFEMNNIKQISILNPNPMMYEYTFPITQIRRNSQANIKIEVISKVNIFPFVVKSIGNLIQSISPETVNALENYTKEITLF